jgi:NAD(P)-dependent dehydrogenase (short-subunit alcohol dehydrogenase family)
MKRDTSINWRRVESSSLDLRGLKVGVVGGTGGIGRAFMHEFIRRGADVLVVGQTFKDAGVPGVSFMKADLSLMADARRVAKELPVETLDMLILTTGIMAGPRREVTSEGFERDLAVSYLSRYIIVNETAAQLGADRKDARLKPRMFIMGFPGSGQVANVNDLNSEKSYARMTAHSNTVVGNEVLVLDAGRQHPNVDFFGLNPGFVKTGIRSNLFGKSKWLLAIMEWMTGFMTLKPEVYAERMVPLLVSSDLQNHSGKMFNNKAEAILPTAKVAETAYVRSLVAATKQLLERPPRG